MTCETGDLLVEEWRGSLFVKNKQFWVIGNEMTSLTDLSFGNDTLATCSQDLVVVCSESDYTTVEVQVTFHTSAITLPPPDSTRRWTELDVAFTDAVHLMESDGQLPVDPKLASFSVPGGRYKLRIGRGFDTDSVTGDREERFQIDIVTVRPTAERL